MIWLLSQLWVYGMVAVCLGFAVTWFFVVRSRTVRTRIPMDRAHAARARSGSTKAVGSSLDELAEEDRYVAGPGVRSATVQPPQSHADADAQEGSAGTSVGISVERRSSGD